MRKITLLCLCFILGQGASACGSEDARGVPPRVSGLTYDPSTIDSGTLETITGSVHFDDPDGDVIELHLEVVAPDGTAQAVPPAAVSHAMGLASGDIALALSVAVPTPGAYVLRARLRDAAGNDSNIVSGALNVVE